MTKLILLSILGLAACTARTVGPTKAAILGLLTEDVGNAPRTIEHANLQVLSLNSLTSTEFEATYEVSFREPGDGLHPATLKQRSKAFFSCGDGGCRLNSVQPLTQAMDFTAGAEIDAKSR
jgi:hypothetical protein